MMFIWRDQAPTPLDENQNDGDATHNQTSVTADIGGPSVAAETEAVDAKLPSESSVDIDQRVTVVMAERNRLRSKRATSGSEDRAPGEVML